MYDSDAFPPMFVILMLGLGFWYVALHGGVAPPPPMALPQFEEKVVFDTVAKVYADNQQLQAELTKKNAELEKEKQSHKADTEWLQAEIDEAKKAPVSYLLVAVGSFIGTIIGILGTEWKYRRILAQLKGNGAGEVREGA